MNSFGNIPNNKQYLSLAVYIMFFGRYNAFTITKNLIHFLAKYVINVRSSKNLSKTWRCTSFNDLMHFFPRNLKVFWKKKEVQLLHFFSCIFQILKKSIRMLHFLSPNFLTFSKVVELLYGGSYLKMYTETCTLKHVSDVFNM